MDVGFFAIIMLVLIVGYGVARFAILYPEEGIFSKQKGSALAKKILMIPTFQIFGESFIRSAEESRSESKSLQ